MRRRLGIALLPAAFAAPAAAQMPPIAVIDLYGVRSVDAARVRDALMLSPGDALPDSLGPMQRRIEAVPGVAEAHVSFVCCEAGGAIVYVGVVEDGTDALEFAPEPTGAVRLPARVVAAGDSLQSAMMAAVQRGAAGEDDSEGHSLMEDSAARAIQLRYVGFAVRDSALLRDVLAHASAADQRALAAQVLAYAPDKRDVVPALLAALRDPSPEVRNNAVRALAVIAGYARDRDVAGLDVPLEPFVALLSSPIWTDRNKAAFALMQLVQPGDDAALRLLRERAMAPLVDMARWQASGHAVVGALLLGRIAGMSDAETFAAFQAGDREAIVRAARATVTP